jgi:hypothetical protein
MSTEVLTNIETETRRLVGIGIASTAKIELVDGLYLVPSVTSPRNTKYKVFVNKDTFFCSCPELNKPMMWPRRHNDLRVRQAPSLARI